LPATHSNNSQVAQVVSLQAPRSCGSRRSTEFVFGHEAVRHFEPREATVNLRLPPALSAKCFWFSEGFSYGSSVIKAQKLESVAPALLKAR
jgi:hypothetical protein